MSIFHRTKALDEWHCGVCLGTHKAAAKKPELDLATGAAGAAAAVMFPLKMMNFLLKR